jgi:hypothetical protein
MLLFLLKIIFQKEGRLITKCPMNLSCCNSLAIIKLPSYFPPLMGGNKREGDDFNDFPTIIHPHLNPPPSRGRIF